jgi:hypothetical protein
VIPDFITAAQEADILAALDNYQAMPPSYGGPATISHAWGRDQSYHNMWSRSFRALELGASARAVDFPDTVKTNVIDRMLQVPELQGWAPDSVSAHLNFLVGLKALVDVAS